MNPADTIAAVSSPPGRSLRGLIRVCGPDAFAITGQLLTSSPTRRSEAPKARIERAQLTNPPVPVYVATFQAPRSYTGDDTVEIQLPGHPALLERVLRETFTLGARSAEPGEFTYRAWRHGKLDLLEAEGIAALIAARSDAQLAAAQQLQNRQLGHTTDQLAATLTDALALVEAGIDFTDQEDVVPIPPAALHANVTTLAAKLDDLLRNARSWSALHALPRVVLAGPPSVGKSTLFNALLGQRRAVVDAQPGTTRDAIEEPCVLHDQHEVLLVDLAGLDAQLAATAGLDHAAQQAAHAAIADADLVLEVVKNPDTPPLDLPADKPRLRVQTHADLDQDQSPRTTSAGSDAPEALHVSATTGHHLDALRETLADRLADLSTVANADALALQPRHAEALAAAYAALHHAADTIDPDAHALDLPELVASHLRDALDALGLLTGRIDPDDVIGRVFAAFCVGK